MRMSLRRKIGLILAVSVIASSLLDYVLDHYVFMPQFTQLERDEAFGDMDRSVGALRREIAHLDRLCADRASGEDTCSFIEKGDTAYAKANLTSWFFQGNNVNLAFFANNKGQVVWGKAFDSKTQEEVEIQEFPKKQWAATHPLLRHERGGKALSGVMLTQQGPMLLAAHAIRRGVEEGPVLGTLILGRKLGPELIQALSEQTSVSLGIWTVQEGTAPQERAEIFERLGRGEKYVIENRGGNIAEVYAAFPDIYGRPALLLEADVPAQIAERGSRAVAFTVWTDALVALVVLLALMVFLRRAITSPLLTLTQHVTAVNESAQLSLIETINSKDEIGMLAREFNRMVKRIRLDTEERKRAQEALGESEERYWAFVRNFNGIAFRARLDFTPFFFHGAVEEITGYAEDDFLSNRPKWENIVYRDDLPIFQEVAAQVCASPHYAEHCEYRIVRKNGALRWIHELIKNVCDESDRPMFIHGAIYDITDLKEMHEKVLQTEHLAIIGEMSTSIAHEIKNPLAGISGSIQVLRDALPPGAPRRELMNDILKEVERVDATVRSLLTFARTWEAHKQPVELRSLVERVCSAAKEREPFDRVQFRFDGAEEQKALADPGLMEQVVWNVLANAAHAMPDGGQVRCFLGKSGSNAYVTIADTGCGIPPADRDKVFRPFFSTKTRGTGLGLAICKRIMEAQGGSIALESAPGMGTVVTLTLPKGE